MVFHRHKWEIDYKGIRGIFRWCRRCNQHQLYVLVHGNPINGYTYRWITLTDTEWAQIEKDYIEWCSHLSPEHKTPDVIDELLLDSVVDPKVKERSKNE